MTHASLFSGIGGFDLAAEWMGWENLFHCEWNPFGQRVLKHHFPNSISYNDITKTDFSIHNGSVDILTGGFPCQPYSSAGKYLVMKMSAISGQKCLEQFKKFNHVGLWAKTFSDLLIGMGDWSSTRCKLTWKLKGTKYKRLYFQLVPKTHHTEGIEFGLLLTPTCTMINERSEASMQKRKEYRKSIGRNTVPAGNLAEQIFKMLPTPTKSDFQPRWETENWEGNSDLPSVMNKICGTRSQLNPLFVEEMMGFPPNWTLSAFQNTEKNL